MPLPLRSGPGPGPDEYFRGRVSAGRRRRQPRPVADLHVPARYGRSYVQAVTPAAANGAFTVSGVPAGAYNLFVKGSKWLQKLVPVNTSGGNVTGLSIALIGGDANGDNQVTSLDLLTIKDAYNTVQGDPGFDPNADLNCDGQVTSLDLLVVKESYNKVGDVPAAPTLTGVTSGVGNGCAVLAWTPGAGATGYNVYRATTSGSGYIQVATNQTNPYYVDLNVTNGTPYYYLVTSLTGGTESFDFPQLTVTPSATGGTLVAVTTPGMVTPGTTTTTVGGTSYTTTLSNSGSNFTVRVSFNSVGSPDAPTHLSATGRDSEVVLQWDASPGAVSYNIYRNGSRIASSYTGPSLGTDLSNNDLPYFVYTDTQVNNLTLYTYWVTAVNSTKEGAATSEMDGEPSGSFGWVQRHRRYTTGAVYGSSDYDWTGLQKTELRPNGQSTALPNKFYFGSDNGYEDFLPRGGVNGETFSGPSTYTWEWVPPLNLKGLHNDPTKSASNTSQPFPAPPLFVIGSTLTNVYADPDPDGTGHPNANFNATGYVKDGLTAANPILQPQLSVTRNGPAAGSPTDDFIPRHGILTAVQKAPTQQQPLAAILTDATISPYLQIQVNNAGVGYGQLDLTETAYPLLLNLPNPLVRPDLGDQNGIGNQFVYSNSNDATTALLQVPASISTGGTTGDPFAGDPFSNDITWLINGQSPRVTWKFDAMPSAGATSPTQFPLLGVGNNPNYSGSLIADNYGNLLPTTTDANNKPVLAFSGLPESVYGLGNHTITLGVQGNPTGSSYSNSQTAYIQTFFPAGQYNHPNQDTTPTPNWLYYYDQLFPASGGPSQTQPGYTNYFVQYVNSTDAPNATADPVGDPEPRDHTIHITNPAYQQPSATQALRMFDIDPDTQLVRFIGTLQISSLLYYIAVARHEQGHVDTFVGRYHTSDGTDIGPIFTRDNGQYDANLNPNTSHDIDHISDGWEISHHMDSTRADTTGGSAGYKTSADPHEPGQDPGVPDDQILADIPALGAVFNNINLWNQDWSDSGLQFHSSTLPYIADPYPTDANRPPAYPDFGQTLLYPPKFYLIFNAAVSSKTGKFQAHQLYKITGLSDLQTSFGIGGTGTGEYPTLLTSIQQLGP